ncbi:MAG: hypothetical protein UZ17_ACD001000860 [Acidobacteria bacterium OLB17]|nr:MAG: hypothetical protein UZ17_ACD001000860 [Acidobacteria bacterium OLB17]
MARYPLDAARAFLESTAFEKKHLLISVANHFEPGWSEDGILDHELQLKRLRAYVETARKTGDLVRDSDGTKFRHTNFYPAEQYDPVILDILAEMQADGLGEVEVHLHHGVETPDNSENLRKQLVDFRDVLAERHKCLSRFEGDAMPRYAFVHGNLALANSANGKFCGVDDEMRILWETGCYADLTLPSAPDCSQVSVINRIYWPAGDLSQPRPHDKADRCGVGAEKPNAPMLITGPLRFGTRGGIRPFIEDGALTNALGSDLSRLRRWMNANVIVSGRSDWVFVKLYAHGFFDHDQSASIGEGARRLFSEIVEAGERSGAYSTHFVSAREMFNIATAAIDGRTGDPNAYRNYALLPIMQASSRTVAAKV